LPPSSSPEWFPRTAAPLPAAALPGAGDLADPADEDEDDGVAAAGRRRSGEAGEPISAKTSAFQLGLCWRPRRWERERERERDVRPGGMRRRRAWTTPHPPLS
jgi:hypothetical protein